jgi:hypothetical protein
MQWCAVLKKKMLKVMAHLFQVLLILCSNRDPTGG